jgi:hypothetical protein
MTKHAFFGSGYLNLNLRALGIDAKRLVRVIYRYVPDWPYFDETQGKEIRGKPELDIALDTRRPRRPSPPVDDNATKDLVWVSIDALLVRHILTVGLYERIYKAVDELAKAEDQDRRKAAGGPPTVH